VERADACGGGFFVDTCVDLARDDNFHAIQGGLLALSADDHFKVHINALVPVAIERLGYGK
jgi:CLIP-associating protein 1/2